jgi:hypothetical protein
MRERQLSENYFSDSRVAEKLYEMTLFEGNETEVYKQNLS